MSQESTDMAQVLAIQANIEAIKITVEGMKVLNLERESNNQSFAYDDNSFEEYAHEVRKLVHKLRCL